MLIFAISQNVTALVLDDVTIDENITFSKNKNEKTDRVTIRFHNYPDDITDNLRLTLNEEEIFKPDYTLTSDRITRYYYILIDNSGSIKEQDLSAIRKNVSYLISHINPQDYVEVITVSDYSSAIYKLSHYNPNVMTRIDGIIREGTYSRLYDAVSELNTQVIRKKQNEKASENEVLYYILFFSDGEDIASTTTGRQMRDGYRDIPFYYFCYASDFKPEKNKPFQDIADKHGKFFNYLDTDKIDSLFFSNENRYTLVFFINKKEILKTKSYYIELSKRTTEEGKIIIDLRKYFDGSNLNDMIVDAPKDNTLYHNLKNNLAHDTQYAYNNEQLAGNNEQNITSTEAKNSNDDNEQAGNNNEQLVGRNEQNIVSTEAKNSNGENKSNTTTIAAKSDKKQNENRVIDDDHIRESSMKSTSASSPSPNGNNADNAKSDKKQDNVSRNSAETNTNDKSDENKDDNKVGIAAAAAGTATAVALNNKSDNDKSNNEKNIDDRNIRESSKNTTSVSNPSSDENNTDAANSDASDNTAAVSDGDDTSNDNAAAVIIPAKAEKQQKQPTQNKTVKEKTEKTKETKEKTKRDNKWLLWLLIILLLLLLLLLLLWLLWWLIRKISDNSRAASNGGGGRSSGGIDRTPVETYSPPPTPIASSSSSAAKKPAPKPVAPSNKIKLRIAKDSYRKAKNRIDTNENGIPTFIDGIDKDEGKLKVGSAITIVDICEDHVTAQSMTSLQPDDIVTINKADFLVIYVRYRSKVYTFDIIPLDPNYDIMKNVKKTDSVTTAEKTVAVYGTKQAVINKMLTPANVDIVTNKWSDGTIDNVTGQSDKVIHSDSPLYLDYVVEIQHGAKAGLYLITDVQYENRKYTGKIRPL